jgi:hypothetical protein
MRSLRKLVALGTAIIAIGVLVPVASAGTQKPFHLEKVCEGTRCVITASDFNAIPPGSEINYTGPDADHLVPVLSIKNGTATGNCAIGSIFGTPSAPGHCTLTEGTGRLTQFNLDVQVTFDGTLWYWDGWYSFGN